MMATLHQSLVNIFIHSKCKPKLLFKLPCLQSSCLIARANHYILWIPFWNCSSFKLVTYLIPLNFKRIFYAKKWTKVAITVMPHLIHVPDLNAQAFLTFVSYDRYCSLTTIGFTENVKTRVNYPQFNVFNNFYSM